MNVKLVEVKPKVQVELSVREAQILAALASSIQWKEGSVVGDVLEEFFREIESILNVGIPSWENLFLMGDGEFLGEPTSNASASSVLEDE